MTSPDCTEDEVVSLLSRPDSFPEPTGEVERLETHISRVFLTEHHVWKLKKPVRFDFLDFSTPAARHKACQAEVRLNRRLAEDVYLDVVPITRDPMRGLRLGGNGLAVDWVVKMRRLDDRCRLDRLIRTGRVEEAQVDSIANRLADFYRGLPAIRESAEQYCNEFHRHVVENRRELLAIEHHLPAASVQSTHGAQLQLLRLEPDLFSDRVRDGRIVEGHGDLRPEHIYLTPQPVIIDCIEFNEEFRRLDVADELAFLGMECDALGADYVGRRILDVYQHSSRDCVPVPLLNFYKSYRACVRAKVAALRAEQQTDRAREEQLALANRYLRLAQSYVASAKGPLLLVVRGLMGTGKSTLARVLAEDLGAQRLSTDEIRRELFGPTGPPEQFDEGRYSQENRELVYQELYSRAQGLLTSGVPVIMDGTFLRRNSRAKALELARLAGARPWVIVCHCPERVALDRIRQRQRQGDTVSDARPELFTQQARQEESDTGNFPVCLVDTTSSPSQMLNQVYRQLREDPPR